MNTKALIQLWNLTQEHAGTSGARAATGVLLALYNGTRFPCDLTDLRLLDGQNLSAAIAVITDDAQRCQMEIHEWLNRITGRTDFGTRFEHLAHEYTIFKRGRCKKNELRPLQPARLRITPNPDSTREKARSAKNALNLSLLNTTIDAHSAI
tara:strand:- start:5080 stop:5535 length:456 start_codon:yes stop_codon:yes gene_type:complete